jgi:hypothetical protein
MGSSSNSINDPSAVRWTIFGFSEIILAYYYDAACSSIELIPAEAVSVLDVEADNTFGGSLLCCIGGSDKGYLLTAGEKLSNWRLLQFSSGLNKSLPQTDIDVENRIEAAFLAKCGSFDYSVTPFGRWVFEGQEKGR